MGDNSIQVILTQELIDQITYIFYEQGAKCNIYDYYSNSVFLEKIDDFVFQLSRHVLVKFFDYDELIIEFISLSSHLNGIKTISPNFDKFLILMLIDLISKLISTYIPSAKDLESINIEIEKAFKSISQIEKSLKTFDQILLQTLSHLYSNFFAQSKIDSKTIINSLIQLSKPEITDMYLLLLDNIQFSKNITAFKIFAEFIFPIAIDSVKSNLDQIQFFLSLSSLINSLDIETLDQTQITICSKDLKTWSKKFKAPIGSKNQLICASQIVSYSLLLCDKNTSQKLIKQGESIFKILATILSHHGLLLLNRIAERKLELLIYPEIFSSLNFPSTVTNSPKLFSNFIYLYCQQHPDQEERIIKGLLHHKVFAPNLIYYPRFPSEEDRISVIQFAILCKNRECILKLIDQAILPKVISFLPQILNLGYPLGNIYQFIDSSNNDILIQAITSMISQKLFSSYFNSPSINQLFQFLESILLKFKALYLSDKIKIEKTFSDNLQSVETILFLFLSHTNRSVRNVAFRILVIINDIYNHKKVLKDTILSLLYKKWGLITSRRLEMTPNILLNSQLLTYLPDVNEDEDNSLKKNSTLPELVPKKAHSRHFKLTRMNSDSSELSQVNPTSLQQKPKENSDNVLKLTKSLSLKEKTERKNKKCDPQPVETHSHKSQSNHSKSSNYQHNLSDLIDDFSLVCEGLKELLNNTQFNMKFKSLLNKLRLKAFESRLSTLILITFGNDIKDIQEFIVNSTHFLKISSDFIYPLIYIPSNYFQTLINSLSQIQTSITIKFFLMLFQIKKSSLKFGKDTNDFINFSLKTILPFQKSLLEPSKYDIEQINKRDHSSNTQNHNNNTNNNNNNSNNNNNNSNNNINSNSNSNKIKIKNKKSINYSNNNDQQITDEDRLYYLYLIKSYVEFLTDGFKDELEAIKNNLFINITKYSQNVSQMALKTLGSIYIYFLRSNTRFSPELYIQKIIDLHHNFSFSYYLSFLEPLFTQIAISKPTKFIPSLSEIKCTDYLTCYFIAYLLLKNYDNPELSIESSKFSRGKILSYAFLAESHSVPTVPSLCPFIAKFKGYRNQNDPLSPLQIYEYNQELDFENKGEWVEKLEHCPHIEDVFQGIIELLKENNNMNYDCIIILLLIIKTGKMETEESIFKGLSPLLESNYPIPTRNMVLLSTIPEFISINKKILNVIISPKFQKVIGVSIYSECFNKLDSHLYMIPYFIKTFFSLPDLFFPLLLEFHGGKSISDSSFIAICNVCPTYPSAIEFFQSISHSTDFAFDLQDYLSFVFKYAVNFAQIPYDPNLQFSPLSFMSNNQSNSTNNEHNQDQNIDNNGNNENDKNNENNDSTNNKTKNYLQATLELYYDKIDQKLLQVLFKKNLNETVLIIFLDFLKEYINKNEIFEHSLLEFLEQLLLINNEQIVKKSLYILRIIHQITPTLVFQSLIKGFLSISEAKSLLSSYKSENILDSDLFWYDLLFENTIRTLPSLESFKSVLLYGKPDLINEISKCLEQMLNTENNIFTKFDWSSIMAFTMNIDNIPYEKIISIMNIIPSLDISQISLKNLDDQEIRRGYNLDSHDFLDHINTIISNIP